MSGMGEAVSHLAPPRDPRAITDRVVIEQRRRLGSHELADLAEYQPDLLFSAGVGARLDGVPQRADVSCPQQSGSRPVWREPAHERGLVLLLVEWHALGVQAEMPGHPALELLHLLQHRRGALHQIRVAERPVREPERDLGKPDEPQRLLRDSRPRPVPDQLVREHPADVMQHEAEADVLEDRAMRTGQNILQVRVLVGPHSRDVRVEPRLPGPVAQPPAEFDEVERGVVEVAPIEPLQPAFPADFAKVGSQRCVVDLGMGDEEHLWLHALHGNAHYLRPPTSVRRPPGLWTAARPQSCTAVASTAPRPAGTVCATCRARAIMHVPEYRALSHLALARR